MKANVRYQMSKKEEAAMKAEINRQIIEQDNAHRDDLDAMVLYTLRSVFGFGKARLRKFWEALAEEHDKLVEHYQMPESFPYLCKRELSKIGVDVQAWNNEHLSNNAK